MKKLLGLGGALLAAALPAAQASAETLYGLTADNRIVSFNSTTPGTIARNFAITGLIAGDVLTGIDLRPANNTIYTVATSGNLYALTRFSGSFGATLIGDVGTLSGARYGIDFNPVPDRLRFVTDFDQNLRINPANAVAITDGAINGPGSISLVGAAYTNNLAGATSTTLYALDASGNQLLRSTAPNAGTYVEVGTLSGGIDLGGLNNVGFDISGPSGIAYFSNGASLYTLNLSNAVATSLGTIGSGPLVGLTAGGVPEPATWAMMIGGIGAAGGMLRRRRHTSMRERLA